EQAQVAARRRAPDHVRGRGGRMVGQREDLRRRGDVVDRAAEQEQGRVDAPEVDALATDLELARDQGVAPEEVLDDPQVEGAGDGLRVLEPVLEGDVAGQVLGLVQRAEQRELARYLGLG